MAYRFTIVVVGVSLTYMGFRLFLAGDLKIAGTLFASAGIAIVLAAWLAKEGVYMTPSEFDLIIRVAFRVTIVVVGVTLTYMGFRLLLAGDLKAAAAIPATTTPSVLAIAGGLFAIAGTAIVLTVWFAKEPALSNSSNISLRASSDASGAVPHNVSVQGLVSPVPDSIMQIVLRTLCTAQLSTLERQRFTTWYAAEHRSCR